MDIVDQNVLKILKRNRPNLSRQQYKTLRGQVLAGNSDAAMKGLETIFRRGK